MHRSVDDEIRRYYTFNGTWTAEERLKLVQLLAVAIQTELYAGRYSAPGAPNCQSIVEAIHASPEELTASITSDAVARLLAQAFPPLPVSVPWPSAS